MLEDGTWLASEADVRAISLGCAILGCGGGGSPHLASLKLLREMARYDYDSWAKTLSHGLQVLYLSP